MLMIKQETNKNKFLKKSLLGQAELKQVYQECSTKLKKSCIDHLSCAHTSFQRLLAKHRGENSDFRRVS